jgi:hypothetical protein
MCFKKFKNKKIDVCVGDVLVDKVWGDNALEIIQISKNRKEIRYKFLKIRGKDILNSGIHDMSKEFLVENYDFILK